MLKMKTLLTLSLLAALPLAGCSGLLNSEQPARQHYLLQPWSGEQEKGFESADQHLSVTVSAIPGLDTDRILALDTNTQLIPYTNARWADHLPEVLLSLTRRSLDSTGQFAKVSDGPGGDADTWRLELEIQAFYGLQDSSGATTSVSTSMRGYISCDGTEHPLRLSGSTTINTQGLSAIVRGHQSGVDKMMQQLIETVTKNCD